LLTLFSREFCALLTLFSREFCALLTLFSREFLIYLESLDTKKEQLTALNYASSRYVIIYYTPFFYKLMFYI